MPAQTHSEHHHAKPKLTDEERLAALKARRARLLKEIRRYEDRLGKGRKKRQNKRIDQAPTKADPAEPDFVASGEALFTGNIAERVKEEKPLKVSRMENFENPRGLHSVSDDRTRHEYGVTTKTINLSVETVTDPRTGKSVTACTDEIGPPNSQSTWTGIANTIISVIGYGSRPTQGNSHHMPMLSDWMQPKIQINSLSARITPPSADTGRVPTSAPDIFY